MELVGYLVTSAGFETGAADMPLVRWSTNIYNVPIYARANGVLSESGRVRP